MESDDKMRHSNEFYQELTEAMDHGKSFGEMIPIFNKELSKDLENNKIKTERTCTAINKWLEKHSELKLTNEQYDDLEMEIYEYADMREI